MVASVQRPSGCLASSHGISPYLILFAPAGAFTLHLYFFVHVLCMASIYYCDGVAIYRVGEVPLVGIGHVVASPLGDGRLSTKEGALYLKHRIDSIINVLVHQFLRVRMLVLLRDVAVESVYLRQTPFLDDIPHGSAYTSRIVW